jgi:hypothetical protein
MIADKSIDIKIKKRNIEHYSGKGYKNLIIGKTYKIKCSDVIKTVSNRIFVICENCKSERYICCYNYYNQLKKYNFYVCSNCSYSKIKKTNLEKYGTECPLQNENIIEKSKKKLLDFYGVDNISKLKSIREERKNNFNTEVIRKSKNTWLRKYGVDNPSKSNLIKEKKKKTCIDNYGVENPSQSSEIFEKAQINGKKLKLHDCGLYYRGTYEKDFLDFCIKNEVIVRKGPKIEYYLNGKKGYYHSDFYIEKLDLICEIKSSYYYNKYIEINLMKEKYSKFECNFLFIIDKNYSELLSLINK